MFSRSFSVVCRMLSVLCAGFSVYIQMCSCVSLLFVSVACLLGGEMMCAPACHAATQRVAPLQAPIALPYGPLPHMYICTYI